MATVTVFCGSSPNVSPMFFSEMELFATGLAKLGVDIVFGGASLGLMGHLADKALAAGGRVTGVIPQYLNKPGMVHEGLSELIVVNSVMDRKRKMAEMADVVVAFPGGVGTIDEVTEVLALKQLKELDRPVLFLNFLEYWSPFIEFLELIRQQHMIFQTLDELFTVLDSHQEVLDYIENDLIFAK